MTNRSITSGRAAITLLVALGVATPALAGPPLLCHPFDIGTARSLPWDGADGWQDGRAGYNVANLVADTEALLTRSTPILVRMETLRRAAIYAGQDRQVAARLLARLTDRAHDLEKAGRPDALAFLDAAYITEALRQGSAIARVSEFLGRWVFSGDAIGKADGYALVKKSLTLRPNDPALEFAAALIVADRHRDAYPEHARKARAGASQDALLARNIRQVS